MLACSLLLYESIEVFRREKNYVCYKNFMTVLVEFDCSMINTVFASWFNYKLFNEEARVFPSDLDTNYK